MDDMVQASFNDGCCYTGASMGALYPGREAEKIFGPSLNYGETFAYLFRRFGYPLHGWDDYKELVRYNVTTPMEGVVLTISPSLDTSLCFGYLLRADVYAKIAYEEFRSLIYWTKKFKRWAAKNYRAIPVDQLYCPASRRDLDRAWAAWPGSDTKRFWDYKTDQCEKLRKRYRSIEPLFPRQSLHDWQILPADWVSVKATKALIAAMKDLLRPVNIRDWWVNIEGRVHDDDLSFVPDPLGIEENGIVDAVSYAETAGYGVTVKNKRCSVEICR